MKFTWMTKDGVIHEKVIHDRAERLKFIEWLEYDKSVVWWR